MGNGFVVGEEFSRCLGVSYNVCVIMKLIEVIGSK